MIYILLLVVVLGIAAAVFFLGVERGLALPFWRSFGYAPRASFLRGVSKKTGVVLLDVTPARPALRFVFLMGAATVLLQIIGINLGRLIGGEGATMLLGSLMGAALVITIWLPFVRAQIHRRRVRIGVTRDGIRLAGGVFHPAHDIGQIYVRAAIDAPQNIMLLHERFATGIANMGRGVTRLLAARSWLVTFYHREGGREDVLAGGLTQECAEALAGAIVEILQGEEVSAEDTAPPAPMRETLDIE
ncbi:MAG: hypothetical protein RBS08_06370 [Bdellovibrionales bacterium]|jgi:hypothetical protein|nr:hypothetical protein [Bdellovibrionales bacterium]